MPLYAKNPVKRERVLKLFETTTSAGRLITKIVCVSEGLILQ